MRDGKVVKLQGFFQDITARRRNEARIEHLMRVLRSIRDVNQLITHENDREALLRKSCDILISTRGYNRVWVALCGANGKPGSVAEAGDGVDFSALRKQLENGNWPECCRNAFDSSEGLVTIQKTKLNCTNCYLSDTYHDTAALAGVLRHGDRDYGVLVVSLPAGMADDPEEQSLFHELVGDVAYALYAMESADRRREQEVKFRSYVDNAPYGIFIADKEGHYVDVNPAACTITGYFRDELLSMCIPDLIANDSREAAARHFQALLTSGRSNCEFGFVRKDGERRQWHVAAQRLSQDRFLGFVEDITEHRNLEAQLMQAQKMESIGRLAGGVAHDFNNLLMGIMGYADLCRDGLPDPHPVREWLDEITHEAERSASLTRQLLAFARRQTVAPEVVDLNDLVGNMLKMLRRLIGEDIDLVWQPGADLWSTKIDPSQLDQILANLCVNARDAINGVGKVTIETTNVSLDESYCADHVEASPGAHVMLAVSDDGCGMDHETLRNIFEPFFTTKPTGEGTGLGLATVYGIVKQNAGFVNVYSEPGKGTTFRIYLPREASARKETASESVKTDLQGGTETILLVEDEAGIRLTIRLFLERFGYTVIAAACPEEALRLVADHPDGIDLLITDVVMPGMSGRDLADKLALAYPSMKILYMSGYTANVIAHRGILDEGVQFLSKPIGRDELAQKVREVLG